MADKLTPKQQRFVELYAIDRNGAQAAFDAGYGKTKAAAAVYANRLLSKSNVKAAVALAIEKISAKAEVDAAYVLRQAKKLHERCMKEGKGFMPASAAKALELIGKHVDVQAFKDRTEVSTPQGQPLIRVEMIPAKGE